MQSCEDRRSRAVDTRVRPFGASLLLVGPGDTRGWFRCAHCPYPGAVGEVCEWSDPLPRVMVALSRPSNSVF